MISLVNTEKVATMSKLAIYESGIGKKELVLAKYYKSDYIRYNVLKTILTAAFCYWIVVAVLAFLNMEYILDHIVDMDYMHVLHLLIAGFVICLAVYWLFSRVYFSVRYEQARPHIIEYNRLLKRMEDYYKEGVDSTPKNVKIRGTIVENDEFIDY